MARLYLPNFPDHLHRKLKQRAKASGRTLAAEVEAVLREVLERPVIEKGLQETLHFLHSPKNASRLLTALARARGRSTSPTSSREIFSKKPGSPGR